MYIIIYICSNNLIIEDYNVLLIFILIYFIYCDDILTGGLIYYWMIPSYTDLIFYIC